MIYAGSLNDSISQREKNNYKLALDLALEGMVLLENDGILPLKDNKIALYGLGARHTCFGGTGSGEVRSRFKINIYEGLLHCGFNITTNTYLDKLDEIVNKNFKIWEEDLKKGIKKTAMLNILDYAGAHPFILKEHLPIEEKEEADVAIYVIRREAGEGADRKYEKGDMLLSDSEKTDILKLKELYHKVILIINSPGVIEDIKELNVSAIIYTGLAGMMLGDALGLILKGDVCPSGHLAVSWAKRDLYPISYDINNPLDDNYTDGIFVGYRYFTSFSKPFIYPFGYGLSYTKFKVSVKKVIVNNLSIEVSMLVKNLTSVIGKELVCLYLTTPNSNREKVLLVGFNKTENVEKETNLSISFSITDFATFKDNNYYLDKGLYKLSFGNDVTKLEDICYLKLSNDFVVEKTNASYNKIDILELKSDFETKEVLDLPIYELGSQIETKINSYELPTINLSQKAKDVFNKLSIKQKINLLVGSSYIGKPYYKTFGAAGNTSAKYKKLGLVNLVLADGPQGLNLKPKNLKPILKFVNFPVLPKALDYTFIGKLLNLRKIKANNKRQIYYIYTTNFPSASVIAQTWNQELVSLEGKALNLEMQEYNVNYLLAPGVNIVRDPMGGRNYEYYSEDPYLSSMLAIALAKGLEDKYHHLTLKHFTCNNRENMRNQISANVSERTYREIYLKPFKLALTKTKIGAVMSSYNKLNHTYVCNSYPLISEILRCESNFSGLVMTDWFASGHDDASNILTTASGTNLIMPGLPKIRKELYKAYKENKLSEVTINYLAAGIINSIIM